MTRNEPASFRNLDDHEAVVAFLCDPASYPARPEAVRVIETHMSFVFIAGELVYKLKKPIRLGFVDFTGLESRRRNCEREVALNQRLAPGVYLGLVAVTRSSGGELALAGDGAPVDWLVAMRRLDGNALLDRMIADGRVEAADIDRLSDTLARFYAEARRIEITPLELIALWRQSIALVEQSLTDPIFALPAARASPPIAALHDFLDCQGDLIVARLIGGHIVEGHGDLRPEHVHPGPPTLLIDRLEFDDRLRWTDPFDEIGFLGLECAHLGAGWIGPELVQAMSRRLKDHPLPELLRFYRCYRACLRARLSIEHLRDAQPRTPERWPRQALEYLDLAAASLPCHSVSQRG